MPHGAAWPYTFAQPAGQKEPGQAASPQVALGQPGLSFRYVSTLGVTEEPYQTDVLHLFRPSGVFIDSADNLYTVEEFGQRLLGYNAAGANILSIGHAGIAMTSDEYLNYPWDVTTDSNHNLWVVISHAVKAFDPFGNQLLVFPQDDPWQAGNDNSHFNGPGGVAFDHNGLLFVSDTNNHRIQVYSVSGSTLTYVNTVGVTSTPGDDNEHFNYPAKIAFDSSNALYVMDIFNYRVQKCTSTDHWDTWTCTKFFGGTEGSDPGSGQLSGLSMGITIDSADNVFIADGTNYRVLKCTPAGMCTHFVGTVGVMGNDTAHFDWVSDVAVDSAGKVYVDDKDNMRIQVYTSAGIYVKTIGVTEVPYTLDTIRYNQPWGISMTSNGGLYIYEAQGYRLIKVNPDGSQAWTFGKAGVFGSGNDTFGNPYPNDIGNPAETRDGKVYVPDTGNHRIQIFNANLGVYLNTFGQYGQGINQFNGPSSVTINPTNQDILVADQYNHRVQIYTSAWV